MPVLLQFPFLSLFVHDVGIVELCFEITPESGTIGITQFLLLGFFGIGQSLSLCLAGKKIDAFHQFVHIVTPCRS